MTDAPLPHPDDERLSAALDGDDDNGVVAAHLGACGDCRARSAAFASAAALVAGAAVPPLDPVLLDALIATAVAEADERPAASVVALGSRRRRLMPPPAWLVGAAAALVVLAGVGSMVRTGSDGDRAAMVTSENSTAALDSAGGAVSAGASGAADLAADDYDGPDQIVGDLGEQADPSSLVTALQSTPGVARETAGALSAAPARSGSGATKAAAPSVTTTTTWPENRARCESAGRSIGAGRFGGLQSAWTARWQGVDAEVLVFALTEPAEGVSRQALVLRRGDCALLADPRF